MRFTLPAWVLLWRVAFSGVALAAPSARVAVNFFGLTRSLTHTKESIFKHLLDPLRLEGYEVDVFLHTYDLQVINNPWAQENYKLNTTEWHLLRPKASAVTSQDEFLAKHEARIAVCRRVGHGWEKLEGSSFEIAIHLLCQLNSVAEVAQLWAEENERTDYHAVIFARPDVLYNCAFPAHQLAHLTDNDIAIPAHSDYAGLNDRFAAMKPTVALQYGKRLLYALRRCLSVPIHAEIYMKEWVESLNLNVVRLEQFDFYRVRGSGYIAAGDAASLKGCDLSDLHRFYIPKVLERMVRTTRRARFNDVTHWAASGAKFPMLQETRALLAT